MSKNKIKLAVVAVALTTIAGLATTSMARAEDAASASYQMRLAALEMQVGAMTEAAVQTADPDQPQPIKMKLHRHYKKTRKVSPADKADYDDEVASDDTSKTN
jgi:hypothetical protein